MRFPGTLVVVATVLLGAAQARAAGYWVSEVGTKAIGRSGAFVANPDDPTALWLNPAGLSGVKGVQLHVTSSFIRLHQSFQRDCEPSCAPTPYERQYGDTSLRVDRHPGDTDGDDGLSGTNGNVLLDKGNLGFQRNRGGPCYNLPGGQRVCPPARLVPFLSVAMNGEVLGIPGLGMGFAIYGPNTGGVRYADAGPQRYSVQESIPVEAIFEGGISYRFNRYFGLGIGLGMERLGTEQRVALSTDKYGTEYRDYDVDVHLNINEDFIPMMVFGFTSNPVAGLHIGGSFMPPRDARARGPLKATAVNPGQLNNTENPDSLLLNFDSTNAEAIARIGSPAAARLGVQYVFGKYFDVEGAVVREFWSQTQFVRMDVVGLVATTDIIQGGPPLALKPTVQPKEYRDTWSARMGGDFHAIPGILTGRAGMFFEESAIPERTYDVSVADGRKVGLSAGFSLGYFGFKLTGGWQHIFIEPRVVRESLAVAGNPVTGTIPGAGGQTVVALGTYYQSHDVASVGITMDVGEVALRLKGLATGDRNWWKPEGARDRTLVDAASWLQKQSNL